jgi:hypothetical protein
MKKALFLFFSVFALNEAVAQIYTYPGLAKQFSTSYSSGTARMQALAAGRVPLVVY